jgi:hypothetical protein
MRDDDGFLSSYCFYLSLFIRLDIFFVVCDKKKISTAGVCVCGRREWSRMMCVVGSTREMYVCVTVS